MSLKRATQKSLESKGIPTEYALPAAEILAAEIQLSQRGKKVTRTAEQQEIINSAYNHIKR